jgi:glutamate synthase (NADPH) small chain
LPLERAGAQGPMMTTKTDMLQFTTRGQSYPDKRGAALRAQDFAEISARYNPDDAIDQASRCSQCGVPYCSVHCPLHNHIPDWLRLAAEGRLEEAYALSNATSTMPEICGRICPQDRLCEGNCVIEFSGHGAVTIGSVEKYITDTAWENGWVEPVAVGAATGRSIGIIGAGPAGLTAAEYLRVAGHDVTIYDRYDRAGGLLTYGIPGFKLEKPVVMRRIERLEAAGINFALGFDVGRDASIADLRGRHDALLIATGVYKTRGLTGSDNISGVIEALDFLIASNRKGFGDDVPAFDDGSLSAEGKNVVVIGGGDTAMDCVRTAVRQGAASVRCLYRRDRANMPGSQREVGNAEEEGVVFEWLSAPEGFDVADGKVSGVQVRGMRLGTADASGRRAPEADPDNARTLPADMVIKALGFDAEDLPRLFGSPDLGVTRWGTLRVDHSLMTSLDGVFAAGDIVRGASLVVWGIRDGRDVAAHMDKWLAAQTVAVREAA